MKETKIMNPKKSYDRLEHYVRVLGHSFCKHLLSNYVVSATVQHSP